MLEIHLKKEAKEAVKELAFSPLSGKGVVVNINALILMGYCFSEPPSIQAPLELC